MAPTSPRVASTRDPFPLRIVNGTELIEQLVATGAQALEAPSDTTAAVIVGGVEVVATQYENERPLRRLWRSRTGGGGAPLLALGDDLTKPGCVLAVGVPGGDSPMRSVDAEALRDVLVGLLDKKRLQAIRTIAAELDRLDQAGLPGLKARGLLTLHTLDGRLRHDPDRWPMAVERAANITRSSAWQEVLQQLGWEVEQLAKRGYLARSEGRPVVVVHPKADASDFSRLDSAGRPPEGQLLNDCAAQGARFGLLAAGGRMRLFDAEATDGTASTGYLELDAAAMQVDDLGFLAILGPEYLDGDGFDRLEDEARQFGQNLHARLDTSLRSMVLPRLAAALGEWARQQDLDLTDDDVRTELERASLTLVFRLLFVLYSEGAGHLPVQNVTYSANSLSALIDEAIETADMLSAASTSLWDRFMVLIKALRSGNPAWEVPAYNGKLFDADGFEGTATLERCALADPDMAAVLSAIGRDARTGSGLDFSTMEIGHLGHLYESLLSVRLVLANEAVRYRYNERDKLYEVTDDGDIEAAQGQLLWHQQEGSRKGGGVYYTRSELVRHLVSQSVMPEYEIHLTKVGDLTATDPAAAADVLFDFSVLDPACGSAHFLVEVTNSLADRLMRFLADNPVPDVAALLDHLRAGAPAGTQIDDAALMRRLVLKRCVYGVDLSPMGAEIAKLSLWLASFVPGLSLAYLDRNIVQGNSLIGVARPDTITFGTKGRTSLFEGPVQVAIGKAAELVRRVAESDDRTPEEVADSEHADSEAREALEGLHHVFDLWTADGFGLEGARDEVELNIDTLIGGGDSTLSGGATDLSHQHRFLHWPLEFPTVFSRITPGFDCVVGNPPWDEIKVERLGFFAMFQPGLRAMQQTARDQAIDELAQNRPDLADRFEDSRRAVKATRQYYATSGEHSSTPGDPDLYKIFCQRYQILLRDGGRLGVVLPRTAFVNDGSEAFRTWLFESMTCGRIDFLKNKARWAFDMEPRYSVALVAARRRPPEPDHAVLLAGLADSLPAWQQQVAEGGVPVPPVAFGAGWVPPMLRTKKEADLLAKLRDGTRFPFGSGGRWKCFGVAELHETKDKGLWTGATEGRLLWKGESFGQYDPHGRAARFCPETEALLKKLKKAKPGQGSILSETTTAADRQSAVATEAGSVRIAFHGVSRNDDSRTVIAAAVPPMTVLANSAPYLAFMAGADPQRALCLGVMNSLPFDWQARRFVEVNLNFFLLELLTVPDLTGDDADAIADAAARLSCVDERFAAFADACGVEVGTLTDDERLDLIVDIDARVALSWRLTSDDLEVMLQDFTMDAVTAEHRAALIERLVELES